MRTLRFLLGLWLAAQAATAAADAFDYYTFAITLTPAFCDQNPKMRNSLECRARRPLSVHGLWPEKVKGPSPEDCRGPVFALSKEREKSLHALMPDVSLRKHEWDKHGRCSGLDAETYFGMIEKEFYDVKWPAQVQAQGRDRIIERDLILREFHRLNPGFPARGLVLRCTRKGRPQLLTEVRICLTPAGQPTECAVNYTPNCPVAVKIRGN